MYIIKEDKIFVKDINIHFKVLKIKLFIYFKLVNKHDLCI